MVVSYSDQGGIPVHPPFCQCKKDQSAHYQRKGCYFRVIAGVLVHFFSCTTCRTHITMVPSSCVPYKHYPVKVVNQSLEQSVQGGRSPYGIERQDSPGVHQSTIRRWLNEWKVNSAQLASVASEKLSDTLPGGFKGIYKSLSHRYGKSGFLRDLQVDLCLDYPPMGVFRPLIVLS